MYCNIKKMADKNPNTRFLRNTRTYTYTIPFVDTNVSTTTIQIPFRVQKIVTKAMALDCDTIPTNPSFVHVYSSLIQQQSHGIVATDPTAGISFQESNFMNFNPQEINATHTFTIVFPNGSSNTPITGTCYLLITLEFIEI